MGGTGGVSRTSCLHSVTRTESHRKLVTSSIFVFTLCVWFDVHWFTILTRDFIVHNHFFLSKKFSYLTRYFFNPIKSNHSSLVSETIIFNFFWGVSTFKRVCKDLLNILNRWRVLFKWVLSYEKVLRCSNNAKEDFRSRSCSQTSLRSIFSREVH